jgi:phage shock protein PspC (stress-responsive transcriptional regulator)
MRPVIRLTLNGRELQLEDDAHALVTQYLASAGRALEGNPDRAEILADLEQSIGDKAARFLGGAREVLDREQIGIVLDAIGPVEPGVNGAAGAFARDARGHDDATGARAGTGAAASATAGGADATQAATAHRPTQLSDGALISGVCNGLAKWLDVDATIVRIVAVVLALVTGGAAVFAYLLLMLILPFAGDREAARGLPRASRSLVERLRGQTAG